MSRESIDAQKKQKLSKHLSRARLSAGLAVRPREISDISMKIV